MNGENEAKPVISERLMRFSGAWAKGDTIRLEFEISPRIQAMPDNPDRVAILYGPSLLAAELGPIRRPLATDMLAPKEEDKGVRVPMLVVKNRDPDDWVTKISDSPLRFSLNESVSKPWSFTLKQFHEITDVRHQVYFDLIPAEKWTKFESEYRSKIRFERERIAALEAVTVDYLHLGEMQPERDHKLSASEASYTVQFKARNGREARGGNHFEFEMKVDPAKKNSLVLTYWGNDDGRESILRVGDTELARDFLRGEQQMKFFDITHDIPKKLTEGKSVVKIRISAPRNHTAGPVYGVRMIREKPEPDRPESENSFLKRKFTKDDIETIDPPEKDFFSKTINVYGIKIKAHEVVSDDAVVEAADRIGRLLQSIPSVCEKLEGLGSELQIIGKDQNVSDLPELRYWKGKTYEKDGDRELSIDERTRGVGGKNASCGEENLLKLRNDRYRGRDICSHEFSHTIMIYGLSKEAKERIVNQHKRATTELKLWPGAYAGSNPDEYFAEMTMWYVGTHGDFGRITPRPEPGPEWLKNYDPEGFELLEEIYGGKFEPKNEN